MKLYGAIRQSDGAYAIVGRRFFQFGLIRKKSNTFDIRQKLASLGGKWNAENGRWENIKEEHLETIGAARRKNVIVESTCCAKTVSTIYLYEDEIEKGLKNNGFVRGFCGMCDSRSADKIVEVKEEG